MSSSILLPPAQREAEQAPTAIVRALAVQTERWAPHVAYDSDDRHYERIAVTDQYEAWVLTWMPGQGTGMHDHGGSAGAFAVVRGALHERAVTRAGAVRTRLFDAARVRTFGTHHVHEVWNGGLEPAVSLHVYAPRLTQMTRYELESGSLRTLGTERAGVDW